MREVAEREGIDLAMSYAYSDSESDLPMLRGVGHPVAVNPDTELSRVARDEGWRVIRFDKLGRRIKIAGGVVALAVGGVGRRLGERPGAGAPLARLTGAAPPAALTAASAALRTNYAHCAANSAGVLTNSAPAWKVPVEGWSAWPQEDCSRFATRTGAWSSRRCAARGGEPRGDRASHRPVALDRVEPRDRPADAGLVVERGDDDRRARRSAARRS